nr:uncharacterized protein LOC109183154 [Ipomoea batatas]
MRTPYQLALLRSTVTNLFGLRDLEGLFNPRITLELHSANSSSDSDYEPSFRFSNFDDDGYVERFECARGAVELGNVVGTRGGVITMSLGQLGNFIDWNRMHHGNVWKKESVEQPHYPAPPRDKLAKESTDKGKRPVVNAIFGRYSLAGVEEEYVGSVEEPPIPREQQQENITFSDSDIPGLSRNKGRISTGMEQIRNGPEPDTLWHKGRINLEQMRKTLQESTSEVNLEQVAKVSQE